MGLGWDMVAASLSGSGLTLFFLLHPKVGELS